MSESDVLFNRQQIIDLAIELDYPLIETEDGNELDMILRGEFGETLDEIREWMSE